MKKFFIFLTMLVLGIVSSWAATPVKQITSGSSYYFFNSRFNQYINTSKLTDENLFNGIKFTLTGSDGNYNIYSADLGGYLTWGTLGNGQVPTISQGTSENTLWTIDVQSGSIMNIYPKGHGSTGGYELISQSSTAGKSIALWDFANQGGQWYIYEASDFEAEKNGITSAVAKITSGKPYRIFTEYGNNNTKYYLTADGTLSTSENDAYYFTFTATTSNQYVPAGKAWRISSTSSKYFTNGLESSGAVQFRGSINTTTGQNRDTYEGQVFVWDDTSGKYAVRSTNNKSHSSYAENSYWMVDDTNGDGVPEAGYCTTLEERHYDWQLEEPSNYVTFNLYYNGTKLATKNDVPKLLGQSSASLPEGWDCAYCNLSYSPTTIENATTSVDVTLTWDGPFEFSSGFEGAKWYYLSLRNKAKYVQMSTTIPYPDPTTKPTVSEGLWAFTGDPYNGVKVMNARAGDGKYLKKVSADNASAVTIQDGGQYWAIGVGKDGFYLKEPGNNNLYIHDYGNALKIWNSSSGATDNGSGFQVEEASPVKVTYKLTYNGNVISSYTKNLYELDDATAAAPHDWELPAYCSLGSCSPATIAAGTTEVTIPLNWNGPFDFSTMNNILNPTDAELENARWYYMNIGNRWIYSNDSDDQIGVSTNLRGALDANTNALWAFVGNPIDGVRIINKAKNGSVMVLWTPCRMDATTGYTHAKIVNSSGDFKLIDDENYYVFYDSYHNKIWTAQNKLDESSTITVISSYCGQAINDVYTWADTQPVGVPFGINSSCLTTIENNFTNMFAKMTQSQYEKISIPSDIIEAVVYVYPTTGYYRIKSSGLRSIGESYIGYGSSDYGTGLRTVAAANKMTDVSTVIRLTGSAGTYKISTEGLNVQSQTTANKAFTATTAEGVDFVFTVSSPGVVTIRNAASESGSCQGNLHEGQDGSSVKGVINWQASSDQSKWTVEEAESLTISLNSDGADKYYATFCAPFSYTVSDGTKAYTLEKSGEWLVPTEIEGEVAAGTPVLLKGSSATATLTIGSGYAESPLTTTALTGTYLPKTIAGSTDYVLGKYEGKVGFYHWNSNNLGANRAYLEATTTQARGFSLMFDDEATGIFAPTADTAGETTIYNLSGQRLNKVQKGINIVNGKKVLF